jgi:predicted transcriptional regulator
LYQSTRALGEHVLAVAQTGQNPKFIKIKFRFIGCSITNMKIDCENSAKMFLEISSEQRLGILARLYQNKSSVSSIAKELDATVPEVFRNFQRLVKADLITKNTDGNYSITAFGRILCSQMASTKFFSTNIKYFKAHEFGDVPEKFLQRIGALAEGEPVKGFVKVLEKWKEIYQNADKYIENILYEVPYTSDFIQPLVKKLEGDVKLRSILSESAILPKDRKQVIDKQGIKKLIDKGMMERKMRETVSTVVILNEKEGCVMFPNKSGEVDLAEGFYGNSPQFQEWCHDYFNYCWDIATSFQESKLKKG